MLLLVSIFLSLAVLERLKPLRARTQESSSRWFSNFSIAGIMFLLSALLVRPVSVFFVIYANTQQVGLLAWLPQHSYLQLPISLLLLDLTYYYWHRLNHEMGFFWRFHAVHHVDPDVDVTTALRFHFMEVFWSLGFRILQIILLGVTLSSYLLYEIMFQAASYFHHSNLRLPKVIDKALNLIFVTPRMHGIHHSNIYSEMNANYGVVFSFWDRLHKSYIIGIPQKMLTIGLYEYRHNSDNRLFNLLLMPFRQQRPSDKSKIKRI